MSKKKGPPTDEQGFTVLKGELFWKWRTADTENTNADLALKLKTAEIDRMLEKYPEIQKVLNERIALVNNSLIKQQQLRAVLAEVEAHLGISLKAVSIDDQTGRVHVHDQPQPQSKPSKARPRK